jgi:hypothetical protein
VNETAIFLGRTPKAIRQLIAKKELPVVRRDRRIHIDIRDLERWIERSKN